MHRTFWVWKKISIKARVLIILIYSFSFVAVCSSFVFTEPISDWILNHCNFYFCNVWLFGLLHFWEYSRKYFTQFHFCYTLLKSSSKNNSKKQKRFWKSEPYNDGSPDRNPCLSAFGGELVSKDYGSPDRNRTCIKSLGNFYKTFLKIDIDFQPLNSKYV